MTAAVLSWIAAVFYVIKYSRNRKPVSEADI